MTEWIAFCLLAGVLVVAGAMDLRLGRVPNRLTYAAMIAAMILWTIARGGSGALACGVGLAAALIPFTILYAMGGLGGGDVKLMGAVGALGGGWEIVLSTTLYALIVAMVMAVVLMVRHRIVKRTLSRLFGAALLMRVKIKPDFPTDSPRVPFALAVAVGGLLAGAELLLGLRTPWAYLGP